MAVGIRIKLAGVDQQQYDSVNDHIDRTDAPDGLIFHSSGPIDGGWGVIDFWESRAQYDAFFGTRVQAAIAAAGVEMQGAPDIKEFPVHEFIKS
jgi:quinol monooxygenase YgiN